MSTRERPFVDILQDRRYWLIHAITIPSLFLAGAIFVLSGLAYKLFGVPKSYQYFSNERKQIFIINERFSAKSELEDI